MEEDLSSYSEYTRVSQILSWIDERDNGPKSDDFIEKRNRKGIIGTNVHDAIHQELTGESSLLNEIEGKYFESWKKWNDFMKPEYKIIERRFFDHENKLMGRIDALVTYPGKENLDGLILVDCKTSASPSPMWNLQAHFYHHLIKLSEKEAPKTFIFVQLKPNGSDPKCHLFYYNPKVYNLCMKEMEAYKIQSRNCP